MECRQKCCSLRLSTSPTLVLLLLLFCQLCEVVHSQQQCPEKCYCTSTFVSCEEFTQDTLSSVPKDIQTLVLIRGKIHSFPQHFFRRFPNLNFLEIQFTEIEAIVDGTFSGVEGLEHLAIVESKVGSMKTGAFRGVVNVSEVVISESHIGAIQPGAFSAVSNVEEFSISSTSIKEVGNRAFEDMSDIGSFTFYLNNVTALAQDAFQNVRNLGKVEIYQNNGFRESAVVPLMEASNETNVFSNTVFCQCSNVRTFQRPEMLQFLPSETCAMPETGEVLKLSEVNVTELCFNQSKLPPTGKPQTNPTTFIHVTHEADPDLQRHSSTITWSMAPTWSHPNSDASTTSPATPSYPARQQTSSSAAAGKTNGPDTNSAPSSTFSHGSGPETTPATSSHLPDVTSFSPINGVTGSKVSTNSHTPHRGHNSGRSEDSFKSQNGAISAKQTPLVCLLVSFTVARLVSA